MKSTLPATHLLRQFLLFVLTAIFLLTMIRSAYGLWQFPKIEAVDAFIPLFIQGLRFDIALIGLVLIVPVVVGSLLSVTRFSRFFAKFLVAFFLLAGLILILCLELVTPWFVDTQGLRPDINLLKSVETPVQILSSVVQVHVVPVVIAVILCLLIIYAFWSRMEMQRFLRYRVSIPSGLLLMLVGGGLCAVAIWSTPDLRKPALSPGDSLISADATVNDLAMNSPYKFLYSLALPYLNQLGKPAEQ